MSSFQLSKLLTNAGRVYLAHGNTIFTAPLWPKRSTLALSPTLAILPGWTLPFLWVQHGHNKSFLLHFITHTGILVETLRVIEIREVGIILPTMSIVTLDEIALVIENMK